MPDRGSLVARESAALPMAAPSNMDKYELREMEERGISDVARRASNGYTAVNYWVHKVAAGAAERIRDMYDSREPYNREREQYDAALRRAFAEASERLRDDLRGGVGPSKGKASSKASVTTAKPNRRES